MKLNHVKFIIKEINDHDLYPERNFEIFNEVRNSAEAFFEIMGPTKKEIKDYIAELIDSYPLEVFQ